MIFSKEEITRYSRNILLEEVGRKGQERLKASVVSVVGSGGLGSPVLLYLAASGVGTIRIIDSDKVDLTNLQRQILYSHHSVGKDKVGEAKEKLLSLNPYIQIESFSERLNSKNINSFIQGANLVVEGSDNFPTKFLVNDACYFQKKPLIIGGILKFEGQILGISKDTACYRCVFHSPPPAGDVPTCSEAGVIGAVAGVIGSLQAQEAIQYLLGLPSFLMGKILVYDAKTLEFRKLNISKNSKCPLCGVSPTIHELIDYDTEASCEH
jgi:molybdopterin-synthase adenylyltransferase